MKKGKSKGLNEIAWENLFEKYEILNVIDAEGQFKISADQIKEFREPRLMAKFDHSINLPEIFAENQLAILPVTRGDYVISHFKAYHPFEKTVGPIERVALPSYLQSLQSSQITSEAMALNCAVASGILADFMEDEAIVPTVSGRMGSGNFDFQIADSRDGKGFPMTCTVSRPITKKKTEIFHQVEVRNSQIEIDAAYEGRNCLALFEAKRDLSEDFIIRQLYYPYRTWRNRVTKAVKPIFLVYSNGIYHLYEYRFENPDNYNSLVLVKQKNYSIEDTRITRDDIREVLYHAAPVAEPEIPFPQADTFERVINLCELLGEQELSRSEVTEQYAFDVRQTNYYTDAARYLGLLEKGRENGMPVYSLSNSGKRMLHLSFKQRQLELCKCILSHKVFADGLKHYFEKGSLPAPRETVEIMKRANLYHVESESTYTRRSSTVRCWLNWILGLIS